MKKTLICILAILVMNIICSCNNNHNDIVDTNNEQILINNTEQENNVQSFNDSDKNLNVELVINSAETSVANFEYEKIDGGILINSYSGDSDIVSIPSTIDEENVIALGNESFSNDTTIKAIKIPDTVTIIGEKAFANCSELEIFVAGKSLTTIEKYAFLGCVKLNTIELNEGLETLGYGCFSMLPLISEIYIPASVENFLAPFIGTHNNEITILSEKNSPAEQFAADNKYTFKVK